MDWEKLLLDLGANLADEAVAALLGQLNRLEQSSSGWQKTCLEIVANLLETHGVEGVQMAISFLQSMKGGQRPDLSNLSLRDASDCLGKWQLSEAKDRENTSKALAIVGDLLSQIVKNLIMNSF